MKTWALRAVLFLVAAIPAGLLLASPSDDRSGGGGGGGGAGGATELQLDDDVPVEFGTDSDATCEYDTAQTADAVVCGVPTASRVWIFAEEADAGTDWGKVQQTNPAVCVHSADAATAADLICISHDQTNGVVATDAGSLVLSPASGRVMLPTGGTAANPNLCFNSASCNTGISESSGDIMEFSTGGTTRMMLDSAGLLMGVTTGRASIRAADPAASVATFKLHYTTNSGFGGATEAPAIVVNGVERLTASSSEVVVNEPGAGIDFRVESDLNTLSYYHDAGNLTGRGTHSFGGGSTNEEHYFQVNAPAISLVTTWAGFFTRVRLNSTNAVAFNNHSPTTASHLRIEEGNWTESGNASIGETNTLHLVDAATEGTTNNTLHVDAGATRLGGMVINDTATIAADDATPDVSGSTRFVTSTNTGATAISDLDNPRVDQNVVICGDETDDANDSTIADSGNFRLTAAFTADPGCCLGLWVRADNDYVEQWRACS